MLKVSKLGYKTAESTPVMVQAGKTVNQEIAMEKEQTDLRILNEANEEIEELEVYWGKKTVSFKILNAGADILEWELPVVAAEWVKGFSKESGKLSPGASEKIEVLCVGGPLKDEEAEAVLYIMSNRGNRQLKLMHLNLDAERDLGLKMIAVGGGTFRMGATEEQLNFGAYDEKPVHNVALDGFYIGKYEVTQAQWEAVMGTTIAELRDRLDPTFPLVGVGDNYPIYYVNWYDAVAFCEKLSQLTGKTYRLPTEAEWEYAARGGLYNDGTMYSGSSYIAHVGWYSVNSNGQTHPVGQLGANGLGIYDMTGNVEEWCSDWYGADYYSSSPTVNPQGPTSGSSRVVRGGCWADVGPRVSARSAAAPNNCSNGRGFRVVCSVE
ncbi:SUMF1/EgtB/PvdO family nonheme iron enzyme [bacterium]|nr:SUMF1/EgtB/PvdO family nonheme iron enzyme [bacterium]